MADTPQIDYDALSKDATFLKMSLQQQRDYLSTVDKNFGSMDPESQKGYIAHLTGANLAAPEAQALKTVPQGQIELRQDLGLPASAPQSEVANQYSKRSGEFAGAAAGAMVGGTAPSMLTRALATGLGNGTGALAGGATPKEAAETGAAGTVLQPATELVGSALSVAGKKLLTPLAEKAGGFWNDVTGYTKALEEAKNANLSRYLAAEQKASQAVAEGQANVAAVKAAQPQGQLGNWSDLNQSIGTNPAKSLRIMRGASDIENAYGLPGRGLEAEGFTKEALQKMAPPEQAAAIGPRFQAAGKAVQATADKATEEGVTFDAGKSVSSVIRDRIKDPNLQDKAIEIINSHQRELGIDNIRQATPTQALALRQALRNDANFGPNATIDSLKGVGRAIYSAVSNDLHNAVPGMKTVDMHYGDLAQAVDVVRGQTGKYMAGKWTPPLTAVQKAEQAVPEMPTSSPYTPLPSSSTFNLKALKQLAGGLGLLGGGAYGLHRLLALQNIAP